MMTDAGIDRYVTVPGCRFHHHISKAVDAALRQLPGAPLWLLEDVHKQWMNDWAEQLGVVGNVSSDPDLNRYRLAINHQIRQRTKQSGQSFAPQPIVWTAALTPAYFENLNEAPMKELEEGVVEPLDLPPDFKNRMQTKEASYILDAVASYVVDFLHHGANKYRQIDWVSNAFVFDTTFDEFARRCGLKNKDRKDVKRALFAKPGPLEWILVRVSETTFIEANVVRVAERRHEVIASDGAGDPIKSEFRVFVNAGLWGFLKHRTEVASGRIRGIQMDFGYWRVPMFLNARVRAILNYARDLIADLPDDFDHATPAVRRGNADNYVSAIYHVIEKWNRGNTGKNRRKRPMVISHNELAKTNGILAWHEKNPHRRIEDLAAIALICNSLRHEGDALDGCSHVHVQGDSLVFELAGGAE